MFEMKDRTIPKGVIFSQIMMSAPLIALTSYLCMLAPIATQAALIDPQSFAYLARTSVRLLGLNVAFIGGIHFGLGACVYDTILDEQEKKKVKY